MGGLPDPDWYLDNVLVHAAPGGYVAPEPGPAATWQRWWQTQAVRLGAPAALHGFVLAPDDLPGVGVTRRRSRTHVGRGRWTPVGYGMVAPLDVRDRAGQLSVRRRHALECGAAVRRRPDTVVSGRSAAILHGLPTLLVPARPELTCIAPRRLGRRGLAHVHGARLMPEEITGWHGVPLTVVARTLADLARHDRLDAIMAADAALRETLTTPEAIAAALAAARRWPGVRQARAVLALASARAESPLESVTRLVLHDDGFPPPLLQVWIPGTGYRVDMLWPAARLILECDGLEKYTVASLRQEKRRELALRALGYRVERVGWAEIRDEWPRTRTWLRAAIDAADRTG